MNKVEYLLVCLIEEAAEVQQIASKCLRFGLNNHHPDHPEIENVDELHRELVDLDAIHLMLIYAGILPAKDSSIKDMSPKIEKVEHYMHVSRACGTLREQQLWEERNG